MFYNFFIIYYLPCSSINASGSGYLKIFKEILILRLQKLGFSNQCIEMGYSHDEKIRETKTISYI